MEPDAAVSDGRMVDAQARMNATKVKTEREASPRVDHEDLSDLIAANRKRVKRERGVSDENVSADCAWRNGNPTNGVRSANDCERD